MKDHLRELLTRAVLALQNEGTIAKDAPIDVQLERTRDKQHGDFACNIALTLAKRLRANPRRLAEQITAAVPASDQVEANRGRRPGLHQLFPGRGRLPRRHPADPRGG